jgi:hypothetical protein
LSSAWGRVLVFAEFEPGVVPYIFQPQNDATTDDPGRVLRKINNGGFRIGPMAGRCVQSMVRFE